MTFTGFAGGVQVGGSSPEDLSGGESRSRRGEVGRAWSAGALPAAACGGGVGGRAWLGGRAAAGKAAVHARSGKGPYILGMKTYRYRGHSMSDPAKYRTRDEVDEVRKTRDPIDHLREVLEKNKLIDEAKLKAMDAEVKAIVADAAEFARTSPEPAPAELYTDVYLEAAGV